MRELLSAILVDVAVFAAFYSILSGWLALTEGKFGC